MSYYKHMDVAIQTELRRRELILGRTVDSLPIGGRRAGFSDYAARMPYAIMSTNALDEKQNLVLSYGEFGPVDNELRIKQYDKDGKFTKNIDLKTNSFDDNFGFTGASNGAYVSTAGGSEVGIRPVPGLKSITCEYLSNEGFASRIATVNWSAPSLEALETFEVFLTAGFEVALQWGWSSSGVPLDSNQTFIRIAEFGASIDQSLFSQPRPKILAANGNMDGIGGRVSNFSSKLRDDGGFDCVTEIDAMGVNFFSAGGDEDSVGGLGQVLPISIQQEIKDAKEGLVADLKQVNVTSIIETVTKPKGGLLGKIGFKEKTEEQKELLQIQLQDHMLNSMINLDEITQYYGLYDYKEGEGISVAAPKSLAQLIEDDLQISAEEVLEAAGIDKETQAANVFSGKPAGTNPLSGTTSVVQTDSKGRPTGKGKVTVYPAGVNNNPGGMGGFGCWIAAELYGGWYEPKTILARRYVNSDRFPRLLHRLYMKYGKRVAGFMKRYEFVKPLFRPIFDIFVEKGKSL